MGDRAAALAAARGTIAGHERITLLRETSVLENAAILVEDQDDFLNQVLEIRTELEPRALLDFLQATERKLGRQQRYRWGPREIDLDILAYGDTRIDTEVLTLPHPGLKDRDFLRTLLAELSLTPESIA